MRSFGARRIAEISVRAGIWRGLAWLRRRPFAFWLWFAVAAAFLIAGQASAQSCGAPVTKDNTGWEWDCQRAAVGKTDTLQTDAASAQAGVTACTADYDSVTAYHIGGASESAVCMASNADGCYQYKWVYGTHHDANNAYAGMSTFTMFRAVTAPYCPPPEPVCGDGTEGETVSGRTANFAEFVTRVGTCLDGCTVAEVKAQGPGIDQDGAGDFFFSGWVRYDGTECTANDSIPPEDAPDEAAAEPAGENCATSAAGVEYCYGPYGENCGYHNDKYTCLGQTESDECWVDADGSRYCGAAAPMPPVPDNGTPGVPATPTDTVQAAGGATAGDTYNYYNSGTVAGSSRPAGDSGANPNRPGSTNPGTEPTPTSEQGGDGTGEGDDMSSFTGPALEEVCTIQECTAAFMASISAGPLGQALTGQSFSTGAAACPAPTITGFGESWDLDFHCWLFEEYRALFEALFLFGWMITAARVFLSA